MDKESAHNAEDSGSSGLIPGSERSPGGRHGNPLPYSCLEDSMDRGAWWVTVCGVPKELDTAEAIESARLGYCDCHPGNVTP